VLAVWVVTGGGVASAILTFTVGHKSQPKIVSACAYQALNAECNKRR
jgi:hypothetical protein